MTNGKYAILKDELATFFMSRPKSKKIPYHYFIEDNRRAVGIKKQRDFFVGAHTTSLLVIFGFFVKLPKSKALDWL